VRWERLLRQLRRRRLHLGLRGWSDRIRSEWDSRLRDARRLHRDLDRLGRLREHCDRHAERHGARHPGPCAARHRRPDRRREAVIALLAAALAFVGWLLLGMRKREQRPPVPASARPMTPPREPMPPLPQAQPPRETDPLDMTFPPTPPNGP